jgi:hypothetical protein
LTEGVDYRVENGRWVFTAKFLRERGYCCGSGCRNCPYRDENESSREINADKREIGTEQK